MKEKKYTDALREPYYRVGDGLQGLITFTNNTPDDELKEIVNDLAELHERLANHLNNNYEWD